MIKQNMSSPFSGGNAVLHCEQSSLTFRKEEFDYVHQYYECEDTHERFTTTELDEASIAQVYNQYRAKYGIPFPEEIKRIRQHYGLSATKMSAILGFGENQYRLYENGDMPSEANGKVLMSIMNQDVFKAFVENARGQFPEEEYARLIDKARTWEEGKYPQFMVEYVFSTCRRTIFNGFATQSLDRLKNILLFFIEKGNGVFFTKMNKLLFYTDFLSFRLTGKGMTGLCYKAIAHGPVPLHWDRVYSCYNDINQEIVQYPDGRAGTKLVSTLSPDKSYFTEDELEMMDYIHQRFKKESPTQISETSHQEDAWKKYINSDKLISFEMAFSLKTL
jgi:uncharacterized phage-associated protein/DNA-binding transcriptional regulator YiaG